jgi:dTDP-4-dehydrorhamnose reductase
LASQGEQGVRLEKGMKGNGMEVVLLGSAGQVGLALTGALGTFARVRAFERGSLDLANVDALREALRAARPDVVVNAAAFTDVDAAERDEATATRVNGDAVGALGEECRRLGAGLVHYSTDFVFDGRASRPYREDDPPAPLGAYGRSKLAGEQALAASGAPAIVLRTAWVYSPRRRSFVTSILRLARERETLRVVSDQTGSPTFAGDLAGATALLLYGMRRDPFAAIDEARGIYHLAGGGVATRFELAVAAIASDPNASEHRVRQVEPVPSTDYPLPAPRPAFAPLDCGRMLERFGIALPPWRDALARSLRQ